MPPKHSSADRPRHAEEPVAARLEPPLRFVSAASLFDGHDAAINMIRRLLQAHGAEVVHLGHNRSVAEIVRAAIQEDADAIAASSYQGGHNESFAYMVDMLRERGCEHIRVVVGGGGTIAPQEIESLERYGVERIYTPEDGRRLGLDGMIEDVFTRVRAACKLTYEPHQLTTRDPAHIARAITVLENATSGQPEFEQILRVIQRSPNHVPVIGLTGSGGAGKSSLTDELLARFRREFPDRQIAVVAMDPTRRRSGGALLGDRIRMNSLETDSIFMRSLATRRQHMATSAVLKDVIQLYQAAGFDLILVETAGTGQADSEIVDLVDVSVYVMTSEYGAASQLEKIDMLDYAELVVLNKSDKRGAQDSLRDVRKQWRRNHPQQHALADADLPVHATVASRFNDPGVNRLFAALCRTLAEKRLGAARWELGGPAPTQAVEREALIPGSRVRYLAEIARHGRSLREDIERRALAAHRAHGLYQALEALGDEARPAPLDPYPQAPPGAEPDATCRQLRAAYNQALAEIGAAGIAQLKTWPARARAASAETYSYTVRGREVTGANYTETLAHQRVPKIAVPKLGDWGELLRFIGSENLPGAFPYTGGVYPYRREQ